MSGALGRRGGRGVGADRGRPAAGPAPGAEGGARAPDAPLLVGTHLGHTYRGLSSPVLADISVEVRAGELVGVTGPSGSGKSTLLSVLGLLLPPSAGRVVVRGEDAWASRSSARRLARECFAWILQNSACLEARTALENVAVALLCQGERRNASVVPAADALEAVGLGERLGAVAATLSGGELQRVTVARALASGRPVVLADEPTGQIDPAGTDAVAAALWSCATAGQAVVVATHDPRVARRCDRVVELDTVAPGRR